MMLVHCGLLSVVRVGQLHWPATGVKLEVNVKVFLCILSLWRKCFGTCPNMRLLRKGGHA